MPSIQCPQSKTRQLKRINRLRRRNFEYTRDDQERSSEMCCRSLDSQVVRPVRSFDLSENEIKSMPLKTVDLPYSLSESKRELENRIKEIHVQHSIKQNQIIRSSSGQSLTVINPVVSDPNNILEIRKSLQRYSSTRSLSTMSSNYSLSSSSTYILGDQYLSQSIDDKSSEISLKSSKSLSSCNNKNEQDNQRWGYFVDAALKPNEKIKPTSYRSFMKREFTNFHGKERIRT